MLETYRAYKAGKLSEAEAHAFEDWMLDNEDEALALEGMMEYPEERFESGVNEIKEWVDGQASRSRSHRPYYWGVAAAAIAIIVLMNLGVLKNENSAIYSELYSKYEATEGTVRGANDNALVRLAELYDQNDCDGLADLLQTENAGSLPSGHLYLGVCFMEHGDYTKALAAFENATLSSSGSIEEAILWYSALCHLKLDHQEKSIETATLLVEKNGFYADDAKKLLTQLK